MAQILIVDDDKDFRKIYSRYLTEEGYAVSEAAGGRSALESGSSPDLVLLDMRMPGTDSFELLPQLRRLYPKTKILVLSSYDTGLQNELISGADGYFDKSDGCRALAEKIRALLLPAGRTGHAGEPPI